MLSLHSDFSQCKNSCIRFISSEDTCTSNFSNYFHIGTIFFFFFSYSIIFIFSFPFLFLSSLRGANVENGGQVILTLSLQIQALLSAGFILGYAVQPISQQMALIGIIQLQQTQLCTYLIFVCWQRLFVSSDNELIHGVHSGLGSLLGPGGESTSERGGN